jgi:hypothetical protein
MDTRIPLVYVLSNGRSGSTLLELLLGNHPRAWTVGEFQVLPHDLEHETATCGCGARTSECAFWSEVLHGAELVNERADLTQFRATRNHGKVLRREHLSDLLSGAVARTRQGRAAAYGELNHALLQRVRAAATQRRGTDVEWLVDASKDPYRLLWLADSGRFDLRVVHLIKDPRAFVHSMTRGDGGPRPADVLRLASRWAIENTAMQRLVARAFDPSQVRTVRYETLAGSPRETLDDLGAWLGLDFPADWHEGAFRSGESHAVSGNQTRFRSGGVRLDERWREQAPAWVKNTVWLATAPARAALAPR